MILYEDKTIAAIATFNSDNRKTGDMVQVWIIPRDWSDDSTVCGNCKHRPDNMGTCYVLKHQAPLAVWRKYTAGGYKPGVLPKGSLVRLGAWGDPGMLPLSTLKKILKGSRGHTGYTHQWKRLPSKYADLLMASVDSEEEKAEANAKGWRTFRVKKDEDQVLSREFYCPSPRLTCETCLACHGGKSLGNVVINVHGRTKGRFSV